MPQTRDGRDEPAGAHPIGPPPSKRPAWLIPLALLILAIVILSLLLRSCGDDDTDTAATPSTSAGPTGATMTAPATGTPSTGASTGVSAADVAAGDAGTLFAGDEPVLPAAAATQIGADGSLSAYAGEDATASAISVQSVPADEGFWVGSSAQDRVWVQLTGEAGESDYKVEQGDRVSFTGKVAGNSSGFAEKAGVTDAEGQQLLEEQGQHIDVAKSALELS